MSPFNGNAHISPSFIQANRIVSGVLPYAPSGGADVQTTVLTASSQPLEDHYKRAHGRGREAVGQHAVVFVVEDVFGGDASFVHGRSIIPLQKGSIVSFLGGIRHCS